MEQRSSRHPLYHPLSSVPTPLSNTQCIWFREEILILGGQNNLFCYSYHIMKDEYKVICKYPQHVSRDLRGHVVIQCDADNRDSSKQQITLLSFGGQAPGNEKYTLTMIYQSAWNNEAMKNHTNQWKPAPFDIGNGMDHMWNSRALISGSVDPLLFLLHPRNCIEVRKLKTSRLDLIIKGTLPLEFSDSSCFVKRDTDENRHSLFMFCERDGLFIEYNAEERSFTYTKLPVCEKLEHFNSYSYISLENFVVLFGGSKYGHPWARVYVYSINTKEWTECLYQLLSPLGSSFAILDQDRKWIHIIGGTQGQKLDCAQHLKVNVMQLLGVTSREIKVILGYWLRHRQLQLVTDLVGMIVNYV